MTDRRKNVIEGSVQDYESCSEVEGCVGDLDGESGDVVSVGRNKYNIIYADPPWTFKTYSEKGEDRSASQHYDTMKIQDIVNLPVYKIAEDDSVLFMWATYPNLVDAIKVMGSWGFEYKTVAFTWIKLLNKWDRRFFQLMGKLNKNGVVVDVIDSIEKLFAFGMGYYTRANPEICLLGTRGRSLPRVNKGIRNLVISPYEAHSKKPAIVRDKIVGLFGDIPRVELFARGTDEGWDATGLEYDNVDIREYLEV